MLFGNRTGKPLPPVYFYSWFIIKSQILLPCIVIVGKKRSAWKAAGIIQPKCKINPKTVVSDFIPKQPLKPRSEMS